MNDTVVIGLGSPLMCDEGVGIHLVNELERRGFAGVDFKDLGTSGMSVLHAIAGRRKAIVIDCALMGEAPGTIRRFGPEEVRSKKQLPRLSLHEGDLLAFLDLAARLGNAPDEIVIYGIEPSEISPSMEISEVLTARMDDYCRTISAELLGP